MYELLLKNAWVVDPLNSVNGIADVAIQDGKIAKVQRDISEEAKEVIDFTGKTLQPGIIDSHVHLGEMWGSPFGPRMLAMNGVTTCLDMALTWQFSSLPLLPSLSKMPILPSRK